MKTPLTLRRKDLIKHLFYGEIEVVKISKLQNDKYYTPISIANYCWDKAIEVIGENNISEIIEPSVGDGSFFITKKNILILLTI